MLPLEIKPYLLNICDEFDGNYSLIAGELSCCEGQEFEISFNGILEKSVLSGVHLASHNEIITLEAKCKRCGKRILIFDSRINGYMRCQNDFKKSVSTLESFMCRKCNKNNYSVKAKYEYSDLQELRAEGIKRVDNAYSWIWISLKCNECNTKYRHFLDYETA